jgi:transglutaminase-like putative cysteine protease
MAIGWSRKREMADKRETHNGEAGREPRAARLFRAFFPLLIVLWVLLVLYPNPLRLAVSVQRLASPQVDPIAVESLAASLPSDPAAIEEAVLESVPYRYDWRVYGMPWYFPTVDEVLQNGGGDCKARAIVLASILEAKGIPYQINSSPTHVWVHYDGKVDNSLENAGAGFYEVDPQTGSKSLRFPKTSITYFVVTFWEGFWPPMPDLRKVLLAGGLVLLVVTRVTWTRRASFVKSGFPKRDERHLCPVCEESRST